MCGLEVAAWPILYPWSRYGDTDVRRRLATGGSGTGIQHYSGKQSHIRKLISRCRAYEQEPSLAFCLHDRFYATSFLEKFSVADSHGVTADITSDSMTMSESYWRHEQDITADLVRQMHRLCLDAPRGSEIWNYQNQNLLFTTENTGLSFPIFFHYYRTR